VRHVSLDFSREPQRRSRRIVRRAYATNYRIYIGPALGCAGYAAVLWFAVVVGLVRCTGGG
jgi:hypothetical protein